MITGVVKLAADLPLDGIFPFFHSTGSSCTWGSHLRRRFQSPNVEAAKPMVYSRRSSPAGPRRRAQHHGHRHPDPAASEISDRGVSRSRS